MVGRKFRFVAIIGGALLLQGCASAGLTLLSIGTGTVAGAGVNHTLSGMSYKTFNSSISELVSATDLALVRMAIEVDDMTEVENGRLIHARANDREIEIEFEELTPRTTRMRVVAKRGFILRDAATSTEIIIQTLAALDEQFARANERAVTVGPDALVAK